MGDDGKIHALDARAERKVAKHKGHQPRHQHHQQQGGDKAVAQGPVPGQRLPVQKHHEVRQVTFVIAVAADLPHQVHAHHIAAQRKKYAVAQAQDAGVTPDQIHRQRADGVTHDFAHQRHRIVTQVKQTVLGHHQIQQRRHRADQQQRHDECAPGSPREQRTGRGQGLCCHASALRPFMAKIPCGRFWMKIMMNTSTAILASTAPAQPSRNLFSTPRPSAA